MIDERRAAFEEHNLFYLAVLGLVSASRGLQRLLVTHGSGKPRVPADLETIDRDPVLCSVLGLVALRKSVRRHLTATGASCSIVAADDRISLGPRTSDLLR